MRYDLRVVACAVPGCTVRVTSRVPFHVVSVYGVADARSSLWDRGMGGANLRVCSVVRGAARCVALPSLVTDDTFSLCGPWYW